MRKLMLVQIGSSSDSGTLIPVCWNLTASYNDFRLNLCRPFEILQTRPIRPSSIIPNEFVPGDSTAFKPKIT